MAPRAGWMIDIDSPGHADSIKVAFEGFRNVWLSVENSVFESIPVYSRNQVIP